MGLLDQKLIPRTRKKLKRMRPLTRDSLREKPAKKRVDEKAMPKYHLYMASKKWRKRCKDFYDKYGRACAVCGTSESLNIHHMAYTHLGNELDEELAVLCELHHKEFHAIHGTKRDMISLTVNFIEDKKQMASIPPLQ